MKYILFIFLFFGFLASSFANLRDGLYLRSMSASVEKEIGSSDPAQISFFFIYDQKLMNLPRTAPNWFAIEQELVREESQGIDIVSVSLYPGENLRNIPLPRRSSQAIAMGVFVNHPTRPKGSFMMSNLHLSKDPVVYVGRDGYVVFNDPEFKKAPAKCAGVFTPLRLVYPVR